MDATRSSVPSLTDSGTRPSAADSGARGARLDVEHHRPDVEHHHVVVVGAGFGGVGMAIRLLESGERDFVVLEKGDDVGGTWRDNVYPGCQCDVPSNLYSFSFAPNPAWSRTFAWQGEILDYLRRCTDRFGVRPYLRLGAEMTEARWDEAAQRWRIETTRGVYTADVLVSGHGFLSAPSVPELPGLDRFQGKVFHSSRWRADHDLAGQRVAVVGTGASAIQVVPSIQPIVRELVLFQRTPAWIVPRLDAPFTALARWLFRWLPIVQKIDRLLLYLFRELLVIGFTRRPAMLRWIEKGARKHLERQIADSKLREKLAPTYSIGCKRILLSNEFYPALCQPNARLVTARIREITASGIVTSDGRAHPVDTLILCTGFKVTNHPMLGQIRGRDGRTIAEHWSESATAYFGTTVAGFPNLFLLGGPHTGLGHSSIIYMLESQFSYVLGALRSLRETGAAAVDVRPEAVAAFSEEMARRLGSSVWNSGCASWYLDARGKNTSMWPTFTWEFRRRTRRFDGAAYRLEARREASDATPSERRVAA